MRVSTFVDVSGEIDRTGNHRIFCCHFLLASGVAAAEPMMADNNNIQLPELDCIIEPSEVVDVGGACPV